MQRAARAQTADEQDGGDFKWSAIDLQEAEESRYSRKEDVCARRILHRRDPDNIPFCGTSCIFISSFLDHIILLIISSITPFNSGTKDSTA